MPTRNNQQEIRGARDLVSLWRQLPVGVLQFPSEEFLHTVGLVGLGNSLRGVAWREHCNCGDPLSCVERGQNCIKANSGECNADVLFPMRLGGGTPSWRMATLVWQWAPDMKSVRLIALGENALEHLEWASKVLRDQHGIHGKQLTELNNLGAFELSGVNHWRLRFVTPWVISKQKSRIDKSSKCQLVRAKQNKIYSPNSESVTVELLKAMRTRAHKITALCLQGEQGQRLGAHLVHYVADKIFGDSCRVNDLEIECIQEDMRSRGNDSSFTALMWSGYADIHVKSALLPWLSLVVLCGGGENTDKGFGGVICTRLE